MHRAVPTFTMQKQIGCFVLLMLTFGTAYVYEQKETGKVCGYRVETLKRIRIMNIHLGNIPQGNFRNVTDAEFDKLIKTL